MTPIFRTLGALALLFLLVLPAAAQEPVVAAEATDAAMDDGFASEDERILYALGLFMAGNLGPFQLTASDLEAVESGLEDAILGREPKVDLQVYGPKIQGLATARAAAAASVEKEAGTAWVDELAASEGAQKADSGFLFIPITEGSGASPTASDTVKVHYHGTLRDGSVFDSSVERGTPATFPLGGVISCWTEGVQMLKEGGKARLVCPSDTAYGDGGRPPAIPPGATLSFEVELLEVVQPEAPASE